MKLHLVLCHGCGVVMSDEDDAVYASSGIRLTGSIGVNSLAYSFREMNEAEDLDDEDDVPEFDTIEIEVTDPKAIAILKKNGWEE